jgi:uncharacterized membrane protein
MAKKYALLLILIMAMLILVANVSTPMVSASLSIASEGGGHVVDKTRGEEFTVKITFKNTGDDDGTWTINVVFEGDNWSWKGTPQTLTLKSGNSKTLTWDGKVPNNAPVDSMARLVVYYDDSFKPLDWWIHVVSSAKLAITSSTVE